MGFGNELLITIKARDEASNTLNKIRGNLKNHSAAFRQAGKRMLIASAALTAGLGVAINQAAKFQKQMAQVSTMLDQQSMKHMPRFEKQIKSMAIEFGESTATLADGLYNILSASIPAAQAMDVLDVAVKAAKGGLTDTGTAADAITTILNSYQLGAEKAADVSDLLFSIVKRGKLTFAQLAPNIGKVAAMASNAGMSLEDLGATIATLTRNGIRTEMAMTGIRGVLNGLMGATEESAKIFKDKLGFAMETASLKTHGFIKILQGIKKARMTPEEIKKMFPNVRGLVAIVAAMGDLKGMTKDIAIMTNRAGEAQKAYEKNAKVTAVTLARLKEAFNQLAVEIGTKLLPAVDMISKKIIAILKWYNGLGEGTKKITAFTIAFTAALLALAGSLAIVISYIPSLVTGFNIVAGGLKTLAAQAAVTSGAMTLGLGAAFVFTGLKLLELYNITQDYIRALKEQSEAADKNSKGQVQAFSRMLMELSKIKETVKEITPEYEEQIKAIELLRMRYEKMGEMNTRNFEKEKETRQEIVQQIIELMQWNSEAARMKREQTEEGVELDIMARDTRNDISREDIEQHTKLVNEKDLLDLKSFKKKQKILKLERKQRIKDVKDKIKSESVQKAAIFKIHEIYDKKENKLAQETAHEKKVAALSIAVTALGALKTVMDAEGNNAKHRKAIVVALMTAELALGITRMWSAEATKGVLGVATAAVGTAALIANYGVQVHNLTKGTKSLDASAPSINTSSLVANDQNINLSDVEDTGIDTTTSATVTGTPSKKGSATTSITHIDVGGVDVNLGGLNVSEDSLETTLRVIGDAVKAKTVEGITMAMQIYNTGKANEEEAV